MSVYLFHHGYPATEKRMRQHGAVLIMLVIILGLAALAFLLIALNGPAMRLARTEKTAQALAEAKTALLAYAASRDLAPGSCGTNCARPGELPCPDTNNDGWAETSCGNASGSTGQANRIGRLPWKTLGLDDLRDGSGERLWYAVSNRYKNNTRFRPLNSDTLATITVRNEAGAVANDGSATTGVAAVIIAPGGALVRQDGVVQVRGTATEQNAASNYLDNALGEDNADFIDSSATNGFITDPIKSASGNEILNDRLIIVTRDDIIPIMETRALTESMNALLEYFCGVGNANFVTKTCMGAGGNRRFPNPASFSDTNCLGSGSLTSCAPNISSTHGRILAEFTPGWTSTSVLRSGSTNNWFQQNAWREIIHYSVAPACANGTADCNGAGLLTLNNAAVAPANTKQVVLMAAGKAIGAQTRSNNTQKISETNYLEGENLVPLDNVYTRTMPLGSTFNDRVVSIP